MKTNYLTKRKNKPRWAGPIFATVATRSSYLLLIFCCLLAQASVSQNGSPEVVNPISSIGLADGFGNHVVDISAVFSDPDGDDLVYEASSDNTSVVLATVAGLNLFLTEVGSGTATITLTATDTEAASTDHEFQVLVGVDNTDPSLIAEIADKSYRQGFSTDTEVLESLFMDEDGDALTYSASSSDEGVVIASISGNVLTLVESGNGTATIELVASDGRGGTATTSFDVTINPNNIPIVRSRVLDNVFMEGFGRSTLNFEGVFVDADGDELTLSATSTNESIVFAEFDGEILTVFEMGLGSATIFVDAVDPFGGETSTSFVVSIERANEPPFIAFEIEDQVLDAGFGVAIINLTSTFIDPEQEQLSYIVSSSDPGVISPVTVGDTLYLKEAGRGLARIEVVAKDPAFHQLEVSFQVAVIAPNQDPVINIELGTQTLDQGFEEWSYAMKDLFTDPDGDQLIYDVASTDDEVVSVSVVDDTLRLVEGAAFGLSTVFVFAEDSRGATVSFSFNVIVRRTGGNETVLSSELPSDAKLVAYPNPTPSQLIIEGLAAIPTSMILIDALGRKQHIPVLPLLGAAQIDMSVLPAGVYWLQLTDKSRVQSFRIVKR